MDSCRTRNAKFPFLWTLPQRWNAYPKLVYLSQCSSVCTAHCARPPVHLLHSAVPTVARAKSALRAPRGRVLGHRAIYLLMDPTDRVFNSASLCHTRHSPFRRETAVCARQRGEGEACVIDEMQENRLRSFLLSSDTNFCATLSPI